MFCHYVLDGVPESLSGNIVLSVHFHLRCCVLHVIYRYGKQSQGRKDKEDDSVVFENHGVISEKPISLNCKSECVYRREKTKTIYIVTKRWFRQKKKKKDIICDLEKNFSVRYVSSQLNISRTTVVDWASFCAEVCKHWLQNRSQSGDQELRWKLTKQQ